MSSVLIRIRIYEYFIKTLQSFRTSYNDKEKRKKKNNHEENIKRILGLSHQKHNFRNSNSITQVESKTLVLTI